MPKSHLIDVRTPAEFSTGALPGAVNIEYQLIDQIVQQDSYDKSDSITLYCRSGRRSGIALKTLEALGWTNVRDIGGLEEARAVLKREEEERVLGADKGGDVIGGNEQGNEKEEERQRAFGALVEGLKALEE